MHFIDCHLLVLNSLPQNTIPLQLKSPHSFLVLQPADTKDDRRASLEECPACLSLPPSSLLTHLN